MSVFKLQDGVCEQMEKTFENFGGAQKTGKEKFTGLHGGNLLAQNKWEEWALEISNFLTELCWRDKPGDSWNTLIACVHE
jgi:hypothetical protein